MQMTAQDKQQPQADKHAEGQERLGRSEYRLAPLADGLERFPSNRIATLNRRAFSSRLHPATITVGGSQPSDKNGGRNGR